MLSELIGLRMSIQKYWCLCSTRVNCYWVTAHKTFWQFVKLAHFYRSSSPCFSEACLQLSQSHVFKRFGMHPSKHGNKAQLLCWCMSIYVNHSSLLTNLLYTFLTFSTVHCSEWFLTISLEDLLMAYVCERTCFRLKDSLFFSANCLSLFCVV